MKTKETLKTWSQCFRNMFRFVQDIPYLVENDEFKIALMALLILQFLEFFFTNLSFKAIWALFALPDHYLVQFPA